MTPHVAIQQLKRMISKIDAAAETPVIDEFRICTTNKTSALTAKFWGCNKQGVHCFTSGRNGVQVARFPSEKLALRVREMTGGYVVSMAQVMAEQKKLCEAKLKSLEERSDFGGLI
jgi:hypothetical protein